LISSGIAGAQHQPPVGWRTLLAPVVTADAKSIRMIRARWILVAAMLAAHAASDRLQAKTDAPASGSPAPSGDINVNPYGDPIWQTEPTHSKPQRHVKRARSQSHVHARRARAKPSRHAKATKPLDPSPAPFGRPLNIMPPAARAR
jgi:hypothetical protein